jgi:hypothetical protein
VRTWKRTPFNRLERCLLLFFMVNLAAALDILKLLKKYNIRTLSVKIKEKQRVSRVNILLSYQSCWNKIWFIEGKNNIVTPRLHQNWDYRSRKWVVFQSKGHFKSLCHSTNVIPITTLMSVSLRKVYREFKVRTRCSCSSSYDVHVRVGILLTRGKDLYEV